MGLHLHDRPRRLRQNPALRGWLAETHLQASQFIWPLFICAGKKQDSQHSQVPGIRTVSVDQIQKLLTPLVEKGLTGVLLFGVSSKKDEHAKEALQKNSPVVQAIKEVRNRFPDVIVSTDIALDPYTTHGHDGIFDGKEVLNDETVDVLCEMAVLHARAGAQMVAPSDMMDGRIGAIRHTLDEENFVSTLLMAYTAKYASALYGPFRETLSSQVKGDKKSYQMDVRNRREAKRELHGDIDEGADIVMVKPASWYLDIISDFRAGTNLPVAAYQVSGECAMIELGAKAKLFDRTRAIEESLLAIRRAGASIITTYFIEEALQLGRA